MFEYILYESLTSFMIVNWVTYKLMSYPLNKDEDIFQALCISSKKKRRTNMKWTEIIHKTKPVYD